MLSRGSSIMVVLSLALFGASVSIAVDKKDAKFEALDDLEKDFHVAVGEKSSWKVNDGVFECNGEPNGYICTNKSYSNYTLSVEFRYPIEAGNTGVLNYISGEHKVWPACVEVQGHYERLAQIFAMGGAKGPRNNGDETARKNARKPHTEWNKLVIRSKDGVLAARLNGVLIGKSGPYEVHEGPIGFQSEGVPVHFRNIRIKEQ